MITVVLYLLVSWMEGDPIAVLGETRERERGRERGREGRREGGRGVVHVHAIS